MLFCVMVLLFDEVSMFIPELCDPFVSKLLFITRLLFVVVSLIAFPLDPPEFISRISQSLIVILSLPNTLTPNVLPDPALS